MNLIKRRVRRQFETEGWTLIRGLLPEVATTTIRDSFLAEVKPHTGPLMRQLTSRLEPHVLSDDGYVTNPVVNPRLLPQFPTFATVETTAMRAGPLVMAVEQLLGAPPGLLQAAYYESSQGTLTHVDFNALDRSRPMVGVWIALEDIGQTAGRFYLYPRSHRLADDPRVVAYSELAWDNYRAAFVDLDPDTQEDDAQALLRDIVESHGLVRETPALRRGDAVFWSNRVLHGSDKPRPGGGSRHSLLLHFVELTLMQAGPTTVAGSSDA